MRRRWRPPLWLVVGGVLLGTLALPAAGLIALEVLGPRIGTRHAVQAIGIGIVVSTLVLGALLVRLIVGPITALGRHAATLAAGRDPAGAPAHYGTRELAWLGDSVLGMARALRRRETSLRSFADHATHELKTPISTLRASAELLADGGTLDEADESLVRGMLDACAQAERQLAALRDVALARAPSHHGTSSLAEVAAALSARRNIEVSIEAGADLPIPLSAEGLRIVLHQITSNAAEAGAVRLRIRARSDGEGLHLTLADDGPGISPGNADRLFEPFFTTRRDAGGTGMGLAIVDAVLSAHGAQIAHVPSTTGARFEITFGDGGRIEPTGRRHAARG
ncbi:MAG: HAMP domain-containing sensor histidine kinase [Pseudomonadota bacterium]